MSGHSFVERRSVGSAHRTTRTAQRAPIVLIILSDCMPPPLDTPALFPPLPSSDPLDVISATERHDEMANDATNHLNLSHSIPMRPNLNSTVFHINPLIAQNRNRRITTSALEKACKSVSGTSRAN